MTEPFGGFRLRRDEVGKQVKIWLDMSLAMKSGK